MNNNPENSPNPNDKESSAEVLGKSAKKTVKELFKELYDWSESIVMSMVAVVVVLTFIARTSVVDGSSMLPTLSDKEFLIISHFMEKYDYNDIIVFWANNYRTADFESGKPLVKRVVGLPGDEIEIDFENGIVYRNGTALRIEETDGLLIEDGHPINDYTTSRHDMRDAVRVPEGYVFVLGDNRNDSMDSRSSMVGLVENHYIIGKALWRILPLNKLGSVY